MQVQFAKHSLNSTFKLCESIYDVVAHGFFFVLVDFICFYNNCICIYLPLLTRQDVIFLCLTDVLVEVGGQNSKKKGLVVKTLHNSGQLLMLQKK